MRIFSRTGLLLAGVALMTAYALRRQPGARHAHAPIATDTREHRKTRRAHRAGTVRSAGPSAMRDRPVRDWSNVDEASDESFPASDPPARY